MSAGQPFESPLSTATLERGGITHARQGGEIDRGSDQVVDAPATHESLLEHILEAAERLAIAWSVLCKDASRHSQALAATRERTWRVIDQLQGLVSLARDALAPSALPASFALQAQSSAESCSRPQAVHAANDESGLGARGSHLERTAAAPEPPALVAYFLGAFQVLADDVPIDVWPNSKSKAVLKYLLLNRHAPVPKEVLMDLFWPDVDPDAARNSLNVSIHRLRRALARASTDFAFVMFREGCYGLNPKLKIWTDVDAFCGHLKRARALESMGGGQETLDAYSACAALYNAELLAEDRYDDWLVPLRQELRDGYLAAVHHLRKHHFAQQDYSACTAVCARILTVDACDEEAHRTLMRCYARLSQLQLAQRQYQLCVQTLSREMSILPSAETTELYRQIARRQDV